MLMAAVAEVRDADELDRMVQILLNGIAPPA
jgi:hypothetical protein